MSRKYHTHYEAKSGAGAFTGLTLTKKSGGKDGAVFTVHAADLNGLTPQKGDRICTTDGEWLTVVKVGELSEGAYPLTCKPEGGK